MNWYLAVLKKYVDFNGRARRTEYWMFTLFNWIIIVVLMVLEGMLGLRHTSAATPGYGFGLLSGLYCLAVLLPSIGVTVRRLHDTGRSGWWCLIALVPLVGPIVLLVFMVLDSQSGTNQYGPNPKEAPAPA